MAPSDLLRVDHEGLARTLTTLGSPVRLQILQQLRFPHTLGELRVRPHRRDEGTNPDRLVARQTVQGHLDRLQQTGLVRADDVERGGRTVPSYRADPTRLFMLLEDIRALCTLYAGTGRDGDPTGTLEASGPPRAMEGPRLVLVRGAYEAKTFRLDRGAGGDAGWVIGRSDDAAVRLDYDPYVSQENAVIRARRGRCTIEDLGSKNGTRVNWSRLEPGSAEPLRPGDIVGVGRSLLAFAD